MGHHRCRRCVAAGSVSQYTDSGKHNGNQGHPGWRAKQLFPQSRHFGRVHQCAHSVRYPTLKRIGGRKLTSSRTTSKSRGPNCRDTQVGYAATLLLPYDNGSGGDEAQLPPYALTRQYAIVKSGDSRDMVMVPIATAFEIVGLLTYIVAVGMRKPTAGWVSHYIVKSAVRTVAR